MTKTTGGDMSVTFLGLAGSIASAFGVMAGAWWWLPVLAFSAGMLAGMTIKRIFDSEERT